MLNMKDVRRMVRPQIRFDMPQQSLGLITGALDDLHRQITQVQGQCGVWIARAGIAFDPDE